MKRIIIPILFIFIAAGLSFYLLLPNFLINFILFAERSSSNLVKKNILINGKSVAYLTNNVNSQKKILLIHDFTQRKDDFIAIAGYFTGYKLFIPDLPGHGDNHIFNQSVKSKKFSKPGENDINKAVIFDYNIDYFTNFINKFTNVLSLKKFHILGNLMGSRIALTFNAQYPEKILSLTILNLDVPDDDDSFKESAQLKNSIYQSMSYKINVNFILNENISNDEKIKKMYINKPDFSDYYLNYTLQQKVKNRKHYLKMLTTIAKQHSVFFIKPSTEDYLLKNILLKIKKPLLIIWGRNQNIENKYLQLIKEKVAHSQIEFIEKCGSQPHLEKPAETAVKYISFINNLYQN